jgi:AcrR family transcriptional regulator
MSTSRVERKREAARGRLVAAGAQVIASKGVEGLRLRELAEHADVGFGSFYNHFADKQALVEAVVVEHVEEAADAMIARAAGAEDPAEVAAVAQRLFIRLIHSDPQLAWLIVRLDRGDAILETASLPRMGPVLEHGVATGRFKGIDIPVTVSFLVGATISVMRGMLENRLGPDADVHSARILLRACGIADDEAAEIAARVIAPAPQSSAA